MDRCSPSHRRRLSAVILVLAVVGVALTVESDPARAQSGLVSTNGPYRAAPGQTIVMTGTFSAGVTGAQPLQWFWSFGDGTSASGQTVQKAYSTPGTFPVTLQVQTSAGTTSASTTAIITGQAVGGVIGAGGPYTGVVGQPIVMSATVTALVIAPTAWLWNFGDGTTASGQAVQKTYTSPGTYTVTVRAQTQEGVVAATTTATITGSAGLPGAPVELVAGCTNIVSTWPDGTLPSTIAAAVSPASVVIAIWRNQPGSQTFLAFAPVSPAATNNLLMVNRFEAIFLCTTTAATLTRPPA